MVYFIQADYGPVKIGHAINPYKRMQDLQGACPCKLKLLATMPGGARLERQIHRFFAHLNIRGEWFNLDGCLLSFVENNAKIFEMDFTK